MRSMTFQIDDQSTGSAIPAVIVTITENGDGTVSFTLNVVGSYTGDLRGFFFDLADETLINTLSVTSASAGFTELRQANDTVGDLGDGSTMDGLLGGDGGYDAGVEIGTSGMGTDDYQSFTFTLSSTASELTLEDFSNVDFGVRLTSVGLMDGSRNASAKLLEHTSSAINAQDDVNSVQEDIAPNPVVGNVFANDANLAAVHAVTAVNGSASHVGVDLAGTYGTLHLNADGSYTYTLDNTNAAVQALADGQEVSESFTYTATSSDESTSSSTDSATLTITIVGTNDAPVITAAVDTGSVAELAEDSPQETVALHSASGTVDFGDVDLLDVHGISVTPAASGYLGTLTAEVSDDSTGDGVGQVTWTFEVSDAAVEHLAEGQSITQTYALGVNDGHGGIAMQDVTITITGANDAPEIVAGDTVGEVFEDGSRGASGQLVAIDIDQDAELTWSVAGSGPMTPWANYRFLIDNLNIVRNGAPFFNDDFGNGAPPPAGTSFGYFTLGTFQEFGGRVIMDGGLGAASTIPGGGTAISHLATLNTDIGPDVNQGLKRGQDFRVEARYDLVMPADALGTYGVRLSDFANDIVEVDVRRLADGSVVVALREGDIAGAVPVTVATMALEPAPGDNQIVLRLEHAAGTELVTASFDLLNGGVVTQTKTFTVVADIFSNEDWTRAQFIGLAPAMEQNGVYGTLSVEADGEWRYALNNRAANVQALAQGEHVTDTFTVRVTDEHGASDTQIVTIDVIGSNDAPAITGGTNFGFVFEDAVQPFQQTTASGQLTAFDPDHNAVLSWSAGPAKIVPLGSGFQFFGYSADFHFTLDQFTIERNGATIFNDTFSDGIAPPSAPNFSNGTPANYVGTSGYVEAGGRLHLDGATSFALRGVGNPALSAGQLPVLLTNTDPADLTRGLKSDDSFSVEGRFDLAVPGAGQAYGISLTDNVVNGPAPDQLGDDTLTLIVRRDASGGLFVQFNQLDIVADSFTTLGEVAFAPTAGENQIELRLIHDVANAGVVRAEFDLLGGAGGPRTLTFMQSGHIFGSGTPGYSGDDESYTRAQIVAFGPDTGGSTFQGAYGSLTVQQNGQWTYTLDNGAAHVQALALGQPAVQDVISVRVVDEYGLSSFRPVFVNVFGSNDPVVATGGVTTGHVTEDALVPASGTVTFSDVDLVDVHTAFFSPGSAFGTFILGPVIEASNTAEGSVGWTYTLNDAAVQFLAQGETRLENFLVTVNDNWGGSATQAVTVTLHGTNDGPVAVDDVFGGAGGTGVPATLVDTESNNTIATAQAITPQMFGISPSADVGDASLPRMSVNGFVSPGSDVDFYALQITAGATVTLDIDYGMWDVDTILGLYDAAGSLVAQVDDRFPETVGGGGSVFGYDSYLQYTAGASGTYYVAVSSYPNFGPAYFSSGSSGDYVLNISLSSTVSGSSSEDEVVTISAASLLANDTDVDTGHVLSVAAVSASSALGASVSLNASGNLIYDPTGSPELQALNEGQVAVDTLTYTVTDEHGATDTATVTLTVSGVTDATPNLPPLALPDTNAGDAVIETGFAPGAPAGDAFATGNVLANDVDPDPNPGLHVTALNGVPLMAGTSFATGTYGGLQLMADGTWSYTLHDFDADTNALAQGEAASDQFTYTVSDAQGASATTTLAIAISGTNDFPTLEPVGNTGDVTEDGQSTTGGQLVGSDPDHGAILTYGLPFNASNGFAADYLFGIDHFTVTRFRPGLDAAPVPILNDDFSDGVPPPNGLFSDNTPAYFSTGTFSEADGRALMDGDVPQLTFNFGGGITVGHTTVVTTNTGTDPSRGLRATHSFDAMGRFDAVLPQYAGQAYGIALTDQRMGFGGDDHIQLLVRRDEDGMVRVVLREGDAAANSLTPIDRIALEPVVDGDQIVLHLTHDPAQPGTIVGSFEVLHGAQIAQSHTFAATGQIFGTETPGLLSDDETFTRAMFLATSPAQIYSRTGVYGTVVLDASGEWHYTLNNADPDTQALAQGATAVDSFDALAIDQFRTAGIRPIEVTVHGTNDAPVAVNDIVPAPVSEDAQAVINVVTNDFDVDTGDHVRVTAHDGVSFYGAAIALNPDGTFQYDPTNALALQGLNDGEVLVDTFTYAITDEIANSSSATVSVTIHGVTDGNSAPVALADNNDNDPVFEAGVTFTGLPFAGDPTASGNVLANDTDPDAGDELRVIALSGVQLPGSGSLTLGLTYGSLQINADGSWTYTLDNSDPDTNALRQVQPVFAEPVFEHVSYTVADEDGATDTEMLSIRISGTNDAPVAVPDSNTVTEDVLLTAVGNVLTNDYDPEGDAIQVIGPGTIPGTYGTLTLNQDGSYVYQLDPARANFLDAGQVVHDIFENRYVVAEGFGGFAQTFATLLDIAVTGTDEAPSVADGAVFEDGGRKASGELVTTSVDLNAAPVWSIVGGGPMTQVADYRYLIDNLRIVRNGAQFFNDDFGNGLPPPSAPINANPGYFTSGTFQEIGSRVIMDGSFAGAAGSGFVGHFATLNTDTTTSTTQGLKRNHSFTVEARFELVLPTEALQTYGVRLTDAGTPGGGDDIVEISVRRLADGSFAVLLRETNVVGGTPTILGSIPLVRAPGDQLIVLRLEHAADSDIVTASFDILNGGAISQSHSFNEVGAVGHIFGNGETFTRAQIVGLSPSHAQNGVYGTLSVESDGDWTYSLNNGIANVQALAQGERVTDTFTVQVTDANGVSETHTVAVDVFGTNDTPTPNAAINSFFFGGGINGAYVVEDGLPQTTQGTTFVSDIDHGPRAHFSVTANAVPGPVTPYSSDYLFRIDEVKIIKDGAVSTLDTFNDGAAPGTTNGGDYFATGAFSETGGRAILDGHRASAISGTATSDLVVGNVALLNTNQRAEDPQRGFKTGHDFMAEARFDFDANFTPAAGQGFGIAFTDRAGGEIPPNQVGDDSINLLVLRDEMGNVVVQFDERDAVSDSISVIGSMTLLPVPLGSQIVLRLEHDTADLGRLQASFDVIDGGGSLLQTGAFAEAAHREDRIFGLETPDDPSDDEGWTRFQFLAFGRDTSGTSAEGSFGTLSIAEDGDWTYALNSTPGSAQWANLQALNQGQIAVDSFNIRAVDAEGASNSRPLNISVIGTGDGVAAPVNAVGGPGSDVLVGSTLADLITGNGGGDLLIGLGGRDTFDYNSINDGTDTIIDFTPGVGGDVLDIRDVLQGYTPDPAVSPFNFVQIQTAVSATSMSTTVAVNADGVGFDYVPIVTLQGVAGLFLHEMMANGNLVLA